jgi:hypothetical protein
LIPPPEKIAGGKERRSRHPEGFFEFDFRKKRKGMN